MGCATATIKYLVFLFNALCAFLGIATIVVNALALKNAEDGTKIILVFLIVIGSIVFIISFFGCCGAIKENACMTWTYAIFLLLLLIAGCVLVFGYLQRNTIEERAKEDLEITWQQQLNGTDADMSSIQKNLDCCGLNGPQDYTNANLTIPQSCYGNNSTTALYTHGCLEALTNFYDSAADLVRIFTWSLIGVEGVAFLFACILAISFNNQDRRTRY